MNKITSEDFGFFQHDSLNVDFIVFNIVNLDSNQILKLTSYFQTLGFNSYQKNREENKSRQELNIDLKNKFELTFILNVPYQKEIMQLQFSGVSGKQFYQLIKQNYIQWEKLTKFYLILSRFDLVYERTNKSNDKIDSKKFINSCFEQFQDYHPQKNLVVEKNKKGLLFKIGNRRSTRHYRLYTKENFLRFEFEIKRNLVKDLHQLLIQKHFEEFERILSYQFFKYSFEIFQCSQQPSHLDWLMNRLRPYQNRNQLGLEASLIHAHYIKQFSLKEFQDKSNFITFLQLLVYAAQLPYETGFLGSTNYRFINLRIRDFLKYQNPTVKSTNYYQLNKYIRFFDQLQRNSLIQYFTDNYYRGLVTVPEVKLYKNNEKAWVADIWLAEELFNYLHPFIFEDLFKNKLTKDQFQVLFEIIQVYSSEDLRKEFHFKQFLNTYKSSCSSQRKTKIKQYFIQYLFMLQKQKKINEQVLLLPSNQVYQINKLTTNHLSKNRTIVAFEYIHIKFM